VHLLPRTYDKAIPDGKDEAFRFTSKYGKEFGSDFNHLLTEQGKSIVQRNIDDFSVI
jgi:hypothetical protein